MRSKAIASGLVAIGVAAAVSQAGSGSGGGAAPERRLVFHERFAGSRLDARRWNTCHWWAQGGGCTIESNNELEWYLPGQVQVGGGRLRLVAERRGVTGSNGRSYPYRSGMVSTGPPPGSREPKFAFRYGKAEIRARVPAGRGLWSAFWLLPANRTSKPEIDVMEVLGHRPATIEMHLHRRGEDALGTEFTDSRLRGGWHTFAIDWRPGDLAWLIDGKVRWRVRGDAVPDTRMYLVANLAVGGDWPGAPDARTRFPSALEIDYVKVWR